MLQWLANLRWFWRLPTKALLLAIVILLCLFPRLDILVRQLSNLSDPNRLLEPDHPALAEINAQIDARMLGARTPGQELRVIQNYVLVTIPYDYDWNNWGNIDYWPTAGDVLKRGREDCDGRAILAASILRSRGYTNAAVVGNLNHIWVTVGERSILGAGDKPSLLDKSGKIKVEMPSKQNVMMGIAFIAVFPPIRSAIILFAVLALAWHPCRHRLGFLSCLAGGLAGLSLLIRWGTPYLRGHSEVWTINFIAGATLILGSLLTSFVWPWWHSRKASPMTEIQPQIGEIEENSEPELKAEPA